MTERRYESLGGEDRRYLDSLPLANCRHAMMQGAHLLLGSKGRTPDLRTLLLYLKRLRQQNRSSLLIDGDHLESYPEFLKLLAAIKKLGFTSIFLVLQAQTRWSDNFERVLAASGLERVFVRRSALASISKQDTYTYHHLLKRLAALKIPVTLWLCIDDAAAEWLDVEIEYARQAGADSVALGYPLGDNLQQYPDLNRLRESLVAWKYRRRSRMELQVALFDFPPCGLSYGEELSFDILPVLPVVDPLCNPAEVMVERSRYYAPHGRLRCYRCLWLDRCPRLPLTYATEQRHAPKPLGIDYFQTSSTDSPSAILRVTLACNEACSFCFVRAEAPSPSLEEQKQRIALVRPKRLTLSGGEPTLFAPLPELISYAKNTGTETVILQTNAVLLSDPIRVQELKGAGLDQAFVSLHSHRPPVLEQLTKRPGVTEKTATGIELLSTLPQGVVINHLIQKANYRDLPEFIDWLHERFSVKVRRKLLLILAFIAPIGTDFSDIFDDLVPRLSDVKPYLKQALERCLKRGLAFRGLETPCGLPRCILDGDPRFYAPPENVVADRDFIKADTCKGCRYDAACFGLREQYVQHYGTGELHAIR